MAVFEYSILAGVCSESRVSASELRALKSIEQKLMWLASYTVHNANTLREKTDSLKVGISSNTHR
jgi:hypothetical protein